MMKLINIVIITWNLSTRACILTFNFCSKVSIINNFSTKICYASLILNAKIESSQFFSTHKTLRKESKGDLRNLNFAVAQFKI